MVKTMAIRKRIFSKPDLPTNESEDILRFFDGRQKMYAARAVYGKTNPKDIPLKDALELVQFADWGDNIEITYRNRIKNRATAMRAFCVLCKGGSPKSVRYCSTVNCPLWNYRLGSNPLRKSKPSNS